MPREDHNKGQEDASEGKYEPPHSTMDEVIDFFNPFVTPTEFEKNQEQNQDYDKGWNHTYKQ